MSNKIDFYTDEHVNPAVIKGLRQRGINVLTCNEANMLAASDEEHLKHATTVNKTILPKMMIF